MARKKTKKTKKTQARAQVESPTRVQLDTQAPSSANVLYWIAFWGLAAILFVSPFFRGLFFAADQQKALLFLTGVFWLIWLWKWYARDYKFLSGPLDYLALGFTVAYIVSTVFAVNTGLAVDGAVAALLCFFAYWSLAQLVRGEADAVRVLHIFYFAALVVALAGLATATEVIHIKDGFKSGRIYGPFQYPNALASYLAAIFFLGVYLWHRSLAFSVEKIAGRDGSMHGVPKWFRVANPYPYLYAAGNLLILSVFIGARSNGGFIVIAGALLLFMIGLPRSRDRVFLHILFTGSIAYFTNFKFLAYVKEGHLDGAWLWILLGITAIAAGQFLIDLYRNSEKCRDFVSSVNSYRNIAIIVSVLLVVALVAGGAMQIAGDQDLQDQFKKKIKAHNLYHRVYYIGDAIEMIKDKPAFGWGGGGWEEAYRSYQSYAYNSNEVHSYYGQLGVETGLFGLFITALILFFFLRAGHRVYYGSRRGSVRGSPEKEIGNIKRQELIWAIIVSGAVLSIHAIVDFDLSLTSIAFAWWAMFALAGKLERVQDMEQKIAAGELDKRPTRKHKIYMPRRGTVLGAVTVGALAIMVIGGSLVKATSESAAASVAIQGQNLNAAIEHMEAATKYNPLNPDYHLQLAQYYSHAGEPSLAWEAGERALARGKRLADRYSVLAVLAQSVGDTDRAIAYAEKAVELAPFQLKWFEDLSRMYFVIGINEIGSGEKEDAREHMLKAVEIPQRVQKVADSVPEEKEWLTRSVKVTAPINLSVGIAQYFLDQPEDAEKNLKKAVEGKETKAEASFWMSIFYDSRGNEKKASEYYKQAEELIPELIDSYDVLRSLPLL